jgi:hypothetical protein
LKNKTNAYGNFEDKIETIESLGKQQNKPLIGLEYLAELFVVKDKEPSYICTLCDKK